MKKTIQTYFYTCLIFFIPFLLISIILSIFSYFMQINQFFIHIIIQILSYFFLTMAALYLTSHLPQHRLFHCICFAILYLLISTLIHLGQIQYIHLILKPALFIFIGAIKELRTRMIA